MDQLEGISDTLKYEEIHLYDFDNTLFYTPVPNERLWTSSTYHFIQSSKNLVMGSWWTNPIILQSTGEGYRYELANAWDGWWNESVVSLVKESLADPSVLTVLLTGRQEEGFKDLISTIVKAKGLNFDVLFLRTGDFTNTLEFKKFCIQSLLKKFTECKHISLYDDRPHHVQIFRYLLKELNQTLYPNLSSNVVEVVSIQKYLDPRKEVSLIENLMELHNAAVTQNSIPDKKLLRMDAEHVYSGYCLTPESRNTLLDRFLETFMKTLGATYTRQKVCYFCDCVVIVNQERKNTPLLLKEFYGDIISWEVEAFGSHKNYLYLKVSPILTDPRITIAGGLKEEGYCIPFAAFVKKRITTISMPSPLAIKWTPIDVECKIETIFGDICQRKIIQI